MVSCLERGGDLHMAQLMPLLLTVSCFSKIQIGFTFLIPAHLGSPGQRTVKRVCVCVCVCVANWIRWLPCWILCFTAGGIWLLLIAWKHCISLLFNISVRFTKIQGLCSHSLTVVTLNFYDVCNNTLHHHGAFVILIPFWLLLKMRCIMHFNRNCKNFVFQNLLFWWNYLLNHTGLKLWLWSFRCLKTDGSFTFDFMKMTQFWF